MKFIQKSYIQIISVIVIITILGIVLYFKKQNIQSIPVTENTSVNVQDTKITIPQKNEIQRQPQSSPQQNITTGYISIITGEVPIHIPLVVGDTLYETLHNAGVQGTILFSGREYPGLGFFVTAIGLLESGDGKNLMYFINGTEASVGVSVYVPHDGDVIEWKLE